MVTTAHIDVDKNTEILARLKSIEDQVRGAPRMLKEDRTCLEIIDQLAALRGATQAVCLQALELFTTSCLQEHTNDRGEVLAEVITAISRLTR
jgi:DNA-binding FrmR family transcriptional regulator